MVLTHYCVLTAEDEPKLLVMRPYQICATERILNRILVSELDKRRLGTVDAGGYVPQFLFGKEAGKRVAAGRR